MSLRCPRTCSVRHKSGGNTRRATKRGDAVLREALYLAAEYARRLDLALAAKYHRLMVAAGKKHRSAVCHAAATLLTASWPASGPAPPTSCATLTVPSSPVNRAARFLDGNSEVLEALVNDMYARGLSTCDIEDAFRDSTGELLISKSAVSEITDRLWKDYQAFTTRYLSGIEVGYIFVDARFEWLRRHGAKEALLVGLCIASDGRKHLLHLAVGNKDCEAPGPSSSPHARPRVADADHQNE